MRQCGDWPDFSNLEAERSLAFSHSLANVDTLSPEQYQQRRVCLGPAFKSQDVHLWL